MKKENLFWLFIVFIIIITGCGKKGDLEISSDPNTRISAGKTHSLYLDENGTIWTFGENIYGELGNNSDNDSNIAIRVDTTGVLNGKKIVSVAAGEFHSLALDSDGRVYAWGMNDLGQVGSGTEIFNRVPIEVDDTGVLKNQKLVMISAKYHYGKGNIAVGEDGSFYKWGATGNYTGENVPVIIEGTEILKGKKIIAIAAGDAHYVALDSNGEVYTWGNNTYGQLGNGTFKDSSTPALVDTKGVLKGKKIVSISAGIGYTTALDSEGNVYAWGYNGDGQLGTTTTENSNVPVKVDTSGVLKGKRIIKLSSGSFHTVVIDEDNKLYAWGQNSFGILGNGSSDLSIDIGVPVEVDMSGVLKGKKIVDVSAGDLFTLALDSENNLYAWGHNNHGQLGNGTNEDSSVPVAVIFQQ